MANGDERFKRLMRFEIARAEAFYQDAAELQRWLEPDGKAVYGVMSGIYRGLLDEIKRLDGRRVQPSRAAQRLAQAAYRRAWLFVRPASPLCRIGRGSANITDAPQMTAFDRESHARAAQRRGGGRRPGRPGGGGAAGRTAG